MIGSSFESNPFAVRQTFELDVEGAERDILASSGGWMGRTAIVIAELHEHLLPGCAGAFAAATAGRRNRRLPGEKWLSTQA